MKPASGQETRPLTFGRYEALLRIGRGGMAEVYAGRVRGEAGFQKLVAIKRMLPHLAEDERFSAMFLDEARLAAHISSPYVVTTHDLGRADDGSLYLVMELVVGSTLSSFLRLAASQGRCVPLPVSVEVLAQAAQGLHDAHEAKTPLGEPLEIVHRDVSPQNILIGVDGRARITDFGVARAMMRRSDTSTGELKGKLAYFSPEQVKDGPLDRRSDIFALGIVAWETLTSRRLFKADNPLALLDRIMNMPIPSVRRFNPEVPEAVDAAVARALSRDLDERYPDGMAFAMALRAACPECGSRKDLSAYVRAEASERIERMEESLRAALARGDQTSIPAPSDARSGITRRNQLEELKRAQAHQPESPSEQLTAANNGPQTRRLAATDLNDESFDTISSSAVLADSSAGDESMSAMDDDIDAFDDGPTFAMEHAPDFDRSPEPHRVGAETALEEFDEDALALAAEVTVAADPYESGANAPRGDRAASAAFAHAPQVVERVSPPMIPWKLVGLVAGIAVAISIALVGRSWFGEQADPPVDQAKPVVDPFATTPQVPSEDTTPQVPSEDTSREEVAAPAGQALAERTSPQELLEEVRRRKAAEEAAAKQAAEEQKRKEEADSARAAARRAAARTSPSQTRRSTSSGSAKSPSNQEKKPSDDGRKHGRGGIRLDF